MTGGAAFQLKRAVFKNERALLVGVALDTRRICANPELRLFLFEAAMRIVAVTAVHRAFEDFMSEGFAELRFCFVMTGHAELRFVGIKHRSCCLTGLLHGYITD